MSSQEKPVIAQKFPFGMELEAGKKYFWCACGKSVNQPFCDGSHKGTDFVPQQFTVEESKTYWLCGCKHSATQPFCDGGHKVL